jgi:hypothetical protein
MQCAAPTLARNIDYEAFVDTQVNALIIAQNVLIKHWDLSFGTGKLLSRQYKFGK